MEGYVHALIELEYYGWDNLQLLTVKIKTKL